MAFSKYLLSIDSIKLVCALRIQQLLNAHTTILDRMKNIILFISWALIAVVLSSCQPREDNYIIKSVSFRQVSVSDSLNNNKNFYILKFDIEFCNRAYTWGGNSISPGLKGMLYPVDSIRVYDIYNRDITDKISGYGLDFGQYFTINGEKEFVYSPLSLDNMAKDINNKELSTLGLKITDGRLFETDTIFVPKYIQLYYYDSVLSSKIELINKIMVNPIH